MIFEFYGLSLEGSMTKQRRSIIDLACKTAMQKTGCEVAKTWNVKDFSPGVLWRKKKENAHRTEHPRPVLGRVNLIRKWKMEQDLQAT